MSFEYFDKLSFDGRKRYMLKLDTVKLKECPNRLPKGAWSRELSGWPGPGRFSDSSILRQFDIPTVRYSESWTNNVNLPNIPKIKENFLQ